VRTIAEIRHALATRAISSVELAEQSLTRVTESQPALNAFITVDRDGAIAAARAADATLARGEAPALAGIPIAHKDVFMTAAMRTTCGSRMLADFVAPYDAYVVARLRETHTVLVGKTNMDEFAMGSSNETSFYGPVRNPWDTSRVPGGSSGGAAATSAAGLRMRL